MSNSAAEFSLAQQIGWSGLPLPEAEYAFAKAIGRRWRFDFAWPVLRLAVEVDGGSWVGGRHTRGTGFEADCVKYSEAAIAGWRVVRVTPAMVNDGRALGFIERAIAKELGA